MSLKMFKHECSFSFDAWISKLEDKRIFWLDIVIVNVNVNVNVYGYVEFG